jgi:hypothetical protein
MNITPKISLITAAACLAALSYATAGSHGNSGFGQSQKTNRTTGSGNSAYGRSIAASHSGNHGNSAFGHKQGDASTRTTGSGNSAFGKNKSGSVKPGH